MGTFEIVTKLCHFIPRIRTGASCEQGTWGPPCLGPPGSAAHPRSCGKPPPRDICFLSYYKVGTQMGPQKTAMRSKWDTMGNTDQSKPGTCTSGCPSESSQILKKYSGHNHREGTKWSCLLLLHLVNIVLEVLAKAVKQEKDKRHPSGNPNQNQKYHFTLIRKAIYLKKKKAENSKCWWEYGDIGSLCTAVKM